MGKISNLSKVINFVKKKVFLYSLSGFLALVVALIIIFGIGIYKYGWNNAAAKVATRIVPYPAIIVNGDSVTVADYQNRLDALKNYQKEYKKVDFNSEDGKKVLADIKSQITDQIKEDLIISDYALKNKMSVGDWEVDAEYTRLVDANGGEENLKTVLLKYYGWSTDEFKGQLKAKRLLKK